MFSLCTESYAPALISAFINLRTFEGSNWYFAILSVFASYILGLLSVLLPLKLTVDLQNAYETMDEEEFRARFPNASDGLKLTKKRYIFFYPLYFMIRHTITFSLVFLNRKHKLC